MKSSYKRKVPKKVDKSKQIYDRPRVVESEKCYGDLYLTRTTYDVYGNIVQVDCVDHTSSSPNKYTWGYSVNYDIDGNIISYYQYQLEIFVSEWVEYVDGMEFDVKKHYSHYISKKMPTKNLKNCLYILHEREC